MVWEAWFDERHVGVGFGVVYQDRAATNSQHGGTSGTKLRQRLVVVEPVHECRLLAGNISTRRRVEFEVDAVAIVTFTFVDGSL